MNLVLALLLNSGPLYNVGDCFKFNPEKIKPKKTEGLPFLIVDKTDRYVIDFYYEGFGITRFTGLYHAIDRDTIKIDKDKCNHLRKK